MKVSIQLKDSSQPIEHNAINTYLKGTLFCVYVKKDKVYKYPIRNIWRIVEDYGKHQSK